jgi:hypothetical protein
MGLYASAGQLAQYSAFSRIVKAQLKMLLSFNGLRYRYVAR